MKTIKTIHIIGMGALGILYGKCITDTLGNDSVQFIVDENRYERYKGRTVTCNGNTCSFNICRTSDAVPADLVIVAVKSHALDSAIETMKNSVGKDTVIMSVMNGITSEELIGSKYGMENMIYTVAQGMDAMKFGSVLTYTKYGELHIGIPGITGDDLSSHAVTDPKAENLAAVVELFEKINMPFVLEDNILRRMWSKFMLNVGVNQTCMVYSTTYSGVLEAGEPNLIFISAMREVIAIANAEDIDLGEEDLNQYVKIIETLAPDGTPSMGQDRINKNPSEVDFFAGTVIAIAKKHGIHVPVNKYLYDRVKEIEAAY